MIVAEEDDSQFTLESSEVSKIIVFEGDAKASRKTGCGVNDIFEVAIDKLCHDVFSTDDFFHWAHRSRVLSLLNLGKFKNPY